jgi:hypothetical protein
MPSVEAEWLIAAHDRAPYSLEVPCGLCTGFLFALCETGWGNLGKVENTGWEGVRVVYFHIQSSEGGSPICVD